MTAFNPCLSCGACCASYRVSFYWAEAGGEGVPEALTSRITPFLVAMEGTDEVKPRCAALLGTIGEACACTIYERRPSPCRDLAPSGSEGSPVDQCDRARIRHGLPPLSPEDWGSPPLTPGRPGRPGRPRRAA